MISGIFSIHAQLTVFGIMLVDNTFLFGSISLVFAAFNIINSFNESSSSDNGKTNCTFSFTF